MLSKAIWAAKWASRPRRRPSRFALAGIPAFRLVAGYDDPAAHPRFVLTPGDTRDKVATAELTMAARLAATMTAAACQAEQSEALAWRRRD